MELLTRAFSPVMMAMSDQSLLACQSSFGNQARAVGGLGVHFVSKRAIVHSSAHDSPIASTIYYNVKKGDTLTSIARRHKTSVRSIAEVNDIVDINILQEGQVLLIPLNQRVLQRMTSVIEGFEESSTLKFTSRRLPSKAITLKSQTKDSNTILPATAFPPNTLSNFVKTVAPIFLLVPIVGVCISYFVYGIYCKLTLDVSKQQADREVQDVQHTPKLKRWQMILDDDKETEELGFMHDIENQMDPTETETEEQRKRREFEEIRNSYASLETSYNKFLVDSGLSRSGYWRGGVPSATQDSDTT
ncbi:hypothetical protein O6H91_07G068900 [Diphasiastrum complanatum]|uniref:Uncharacterized protein n=1 Tax=Diphasiastrum complanatum TaxID=34168 RepID=A0ACC2D6N3_DIPCM|nr:hypothetical protein O6H91_07G068900 [Diphasiastrum complanatum]